MLQMRYLMMGVWLPGYSRWEKAVQINCPALPQAPHLCPAAPWPAPEPQARFDEPPPAQARERPSGGMGDAWLG